MRETLPEPRGADDEEQLLARARAGDRAAAERLVEVTYARVFGLLCRLSGDRDRAADLTQEVYRKAWAALPEFRGEAKVSTWLHRIAFTTFLKSKRPSLRLVRPDPDEPAPDPPDPGPGPEAETSAAERAARLRHAVAELPEPLRSTVAAHYFSELPVAVRKRLAKACRRLAVALEETSR